MNLKYRQDHLNSCHACRSDAVLPRTPTHLRQNWYSAVGRDPTRGLPADSLKPKKYSPKSSLDGRNHRKRMGKNPVLQQVVVIMMVRHGRVV
jgi:hypothetical protein